MEEEKKCSKCGGDGPFPSYGAICKACRAAYKAAWRRMRIANGWKPKPRRQPYKPDRDIPKVLRFKARHPERYKEFYSRKGNMDKKLEQIAQEALAQAKAEGMDDEDAKWMAVGAVNREARKRGVVPEDELPPEMNAAAQAVVKEVKKNG